jgi:hypothetical protein
VDKEDVDFVVNAVWLFKLVVLATPVRSWLNVV